MHLLYMRKVALVARCREHGDRHSGSLDRLGVYCQGGEEGGVHPVKEILPSRTVTAGDRAFSCH